MSKHKGARPFAPSKSTSRNTASGAMRRVVPGILLGVVLLVAGVFAAPYLTPSPDVVHPLDPESLDPAVAALLGSMIEAAQDNPRNAERHLDLGLAYEANMLWSEARSCFENTLTLDDDLAGVHLHYAIALRQAGNVQDALAYLKEEAPRFPDFAPMQHRLADALLETGDLPAADVAFRRVIELEPRAPQGYVGLGDVLLQQGGVDSAIQVLEQAVALQPGYRPAYYLLGRAYQQAGRTAESDAALARGLNASTEFLPDPLSRRAQTYIVNVTGRLDMAGAYLEAGRPQDAARLLEETMRYHPTHVMLLNTLATAYLRARRPDDAHRLLERAREIDDQAFFTYLNLYQWALRSRQFEQALAFADAAIERAPSHDDTHLARAQALMELGRLQEALVSADRARDIDPRNAANHGLSGEIAYRRAQNETARQHFTRAVTLQPDLLPSWIGLARTNLKLGDPEAARAALQEAQRIAPDHPLVVQLLQQPGNEK